MEILQLQVPTKKQIDKAPLTVQSDLQTEAPWEWVGFFDDDPEWPKLFDEIERERDRHLIGGPDDVAK